MKIPPYNPKDWDEIYKYVYEWNKHTDQKTHQILQSIKYIMLH